jgi:hypothetical protein
MAVGKHQGKEWFMMQRLNIGMEGEIMSDSILGKREGSDFRGENLRKIFVPGLQSAEKNQICSFVDMSTDLKSVMFSPRNKKSTDEQTSRQRI